MKPAALGNVGAAIIEVAAKAPSKPRREYSLFRLTIRLSNYSNQPCDSERAIPKKILYLLHGLLDAQSLLF
jgi:hypothetical protein